ncbi:MAG: YjbQ family protein [Opitutales bacterium]|nr:YjbQ family protein [Opitutales bacterium]
MVVQEAWSVRTRGAGPLELTARLRELVQRNRVSRGIVTVFCSHTSCSLVLMENADPSAWGDLEDWMNRLVRPNDPAFRHTYEGPDDMPSHIKMALTRSSETIPVVDGDLDLGTWQGLFLWEHRSAPHTRRLRVTLLGEV